MAWKKLCKYSLFILLLTFLFCSFPDGTIKCIYSDGLEESIFTDGTVQRIDTDGTKTIKYASG